MSRFISDNFVPIKVHVKENKEGFQRFGAQWTPTQIVLDPAGQEKHRWEGFLDADNFLAQLKLGLGKMDFQSERFAEAEKRFRSIYEEHPNSSAAPEAAYWAGVSAYKATNDGAKLKQTGEVLKQKYPNSEWAQKSSVWL